ncbi:hypothetical protein RI054_41g149050 [Pseudoscourfieldia marina]
MNVRRAAHDAGRRGGGDGGDEDDDDEKEEWSLRIWFAKNLAAALNEEHEMVWRLGRSRDGTYLTWIWVHAVPMRIPPPTLPPHPPTAAIDDDGMAESMFLTAKKFQINFNRNKLVTAQS